MNEGMELMRTEARRVGVPDMDKRNGGDPLERYKQGFSSFFTTDVGLAAQGMDQLAQEIAGRGGNPYGAAGAAPEFARSGLAKDAAGEEQLTVLKQIAAKLDPAPPPTPRVQVKAGQVGPQP